MHARRHLLSGLAAVSLLVLAIGATPVAAASSVVECGQLTAYTAPDPSGPTDGSLQLGLSDTWTILATATLSPAAETALPTIVNSGPTCLAMDLDDDGNVTAMDFASSGSLTGDVDFDSGSGFYIFDDRLIVPTFVTDANPALAALFATSYQAGTELTVTFSVDTTNGGFTGFDGVAAFCGDGGMTSGGDGQVGDAIIPAAVLDADDIEALEGADGRNTCATVHATGVIDPQTGDIATTTDVDIVVAAAGTTVTPPPTSTVSPSHDAGSGTPMIAWLLIVFTTVLALTVRHGRRRHG